MTGLPPIFLDLAIILITAGIITVVFKWLKQPLVLGYIVAGFIIGPYFPWFPAITDDTNIHVWSDIGIVFLMFALGLEFSIKKLKKVGGTGAVTALTELCIMFLVGNVVGHLLNWSNMDCIFLGCMLAISSTTIIIKSFDDLKLKQQQFTSTVTAVLVVEDLIAVLLLVILSTISMSKNFDGGSLAFSIVKLVFFLIVWFTFGIFLIPSMLKKMRRYMTEETLCVVSVGLCFAMVVMASLAGFSTALGAFVMGTILAETIEADVIHKVITPLKNLFGAVFFVSVGMLVDPMVLVRYIVPILVIALSVILFKSASATFGIILSGKPIKTAVQSGFCFCQIGEFSFIIAQLGLTANVINKDLYPIIVSVSILTTFVTPYMISWATPFFEWLYPKLPSRLCQALDRYSSSAKVPTKEVTVQKFLRKQLSSILVYGATLVAILLLSKTLLKPILNGLFVNKNGDASFLGNLIGLAITLLCMAPFIWAMIVKNINRQRIKKMLSIYRHSQVVVMCMFLLRILVSLVCIGVAIITYFNIAFGLIAVLAIVFFLLFRFSHRVMNFYNRIEDTFVNNFNQRQSQQSFKISEKLEKNFHLERMVVSSYSKLVGKHLSELGIRRDYGVSIISIERAGEIYDLPGKDAMFMPLDKISVIGNEEQIGRFRADVEVEADMIIHDHSDNELNIYRLDVEEDSPLVGIDIIHSKFQGGYHAMIIAIERGTDYMLNPSPTTIFNLGDIIWFVSPENLPFQQVDKISAVTM